jgi:hypothetical protein
VTPINEPASEPQAGRTAPAEGPPQTPAAGAPGPRRPLAGPRQGLKQEPRLLPDGEEAAGLAPTEGSPSEIAQPGRSAAPAAGSLPDAADPFGVLRSPAPQPRPAFPTIHDVPRRSEAKRGATAAEFQPADPFDPEVFNRKYFGK